MLTKGKYLNFIKFIKTKTEWNKNNDEQQNASKMFFTNIRVLVDLCVFGMVAEGSQQTNITMDNTHLFTRVLYFIDILLLV